MPQHLILAVVVLTMREWGYYPLKVTLAMQLILLHQAVQDRMHLELAMALRHLARAVVLITATLFLEVAQ